MKGGAPVLKGGAPVLKGGAPPFNCEDGQGEYLYCKKRARAVCNKSTPTIQQPRENLSDHMIHRVLNYCKLPILQQKNNNTYRSAIVPRISWNLLFEICCLRTFCLAQRRLLRVELRGSKSTSSRQYGMPLLSDKESSGKYMTVSISSAPLFA